MSVVPASNLQIQKINEDLRDVDIAISEAMRLVFKIQGWKDEHLNKRFSGIEVSTWRRYFSTAYTKMRPIHAVAAYSWFTMLPMACFYRGLNISSYFPSMDETSVECLFHSCILPKKQFDFVLSNLYEYLSKSSNRNADSSINMIKEQYGDLDSFSDKDFMFPECLDLERFGDDYYISLAKGLRRVRIDNHISIERMARITKLSEDRYRSCEDLHKKVLLPVDFGARLQLGLGLNNAMCFTAAMEYYPQFHVVRNVQQIRQLLIVELLKNVDPDNKRHCLSVVSGLAAMHLNQHLKKWVPKKP